MEQHSINCNYSKPLKLNKMTNTVNDQSLYMAKKALYIFDAVMVSFNKGYNDMMVTTSALSVARNTQSLSSNQGNLSGKQNYDVINVWFPLSQNARSFNFVTGEITVIDYNTKPGV